MLFTPPRTYVKSQKGVGMAGLGDTCLDDTGAIADCGSSAAVYDFPPDDSTPPNLNTTGSGSPYFTGVSTAAPSTTNTSGLTAAQIAALLQAGTTSAATIYKTTQSPYVIPGTNIIANPGGTPIVGSSTGVTATSLASSLGSLMPIILIAAVAMVVLSSRK